MEFSVLMSVYAKEKPEYLIGALNSTLEQTLKPAEIVIVKDGPLPKELNEILVSFKNNYQFINIIELERNVGLGNALSRGLLECKYNLIARMDTDDICHPERFEKQINYMLSNPDVAVVGSWIGEFEKNPTDIYSIRKVPIRSDELIKYAKYRNPMNHMTVVYRKNAVINAGNYQHFLWNEDYFLWVRMLMNNNKITNIPEILVYARAGGEMFKRRGGIQYLKKDIELQSKFIKMGFISYSQFIKNVSVRLIVRLLPNFIRGIVYKKTLRSS